MSGNNGNKNQQKNKQQQAGQQTKTVDVQQQKENPAANSGAEVQVPVETKEVSKPQEPVEINEVNPAEQKEVSGEQIESAFAQVLSLAKENATDKLHAQNMIDIANKLLAITVDGATADDYEECAQYLISLGRSLNVVSDKVFIAAFPVLLDAIEAAQEKGDVMFTHPVKSFKILTHCQSRGLEVGHRDFITVMNHLAPKASRKAEAKKIDVARNFAILTDEKRTRFTEIFR